MTMTDEQLAELDAASLAAADSYTDFDNFAGILAHAYPDLRAHIDALEAEVAALRGALHLADAALRGANMNMNVVERKVSDALKGE